MKRIAGLLLTITVLVVAVAAAPPLAGSLSVDPSSPQACQVVTVTVSGVQPGKLVNFAVNGKLTLSFRADRNGVARYSGWYFPNVGTYALAATYASNGKIIAIGSQAVAGSACPSAS